MADTTNTLPEGTDAVVTGGGTMNNRQDGTGTGATGNGTTGAGKTGTGSTGTGATGSGSTGTGGALTPISDDPVGSEPRGGIRGMVSNVSTKARDEAASRARGFVGDGLKSGSATLGNISTLIGDTVEQIEEKLGPQYAGYARTASDTIQRYASSLEGKNPDELVDDARDLVRKSPGIALAGAAILGFGLVRLLKAGSDGDRGTTGRRSDRTA